MKEPCWIVWEAAPDGGRPYLVAIDTSEEQARLHVRARKDEARLLGKPPPMIQVEESWLDHLYGESMTKDLDEVKQMVREALRAQIVELKDRLRQTIAIARAEIERAALTQQQQAILERLRDDARRNDDALLTTRTGDNLVLLDDLVRKLVPPIGSAGRETLDAALADMEKLL